jgi:hypothetical protein
MNSHYWSGEEIELEITLKDGRTAEANGSEKRDGVSVHSMIMSNIAEHG